MGRSGWFVYTTPIRWDSRLDLAEKDDPAQAVKNTTGQSYLRFRKLIVRSTIPMVTSVWGPKL